MYQVDTDPASQANLDQGDDKKRGLRAANKNGDTEMKLKKLLKSISILVGSVLLSPAVSAGGLADMTHEELTAWMQNVNAKLNAANAGYNIEGLEFYTIGKGRPSIRIHALEDRWVDGDARRNPGGFRVAGLDQITYHSDSGNPPTSLGTFPLKEINGAMDTWNETKCLDKVDVIPNQLAGPDIPSSAFGDLTLIDELFCPIADFGGPNDAYPFGSDIVHGGWYPKECFGQNTLAFSATFIFGTFTDAGFVPSDINGDNRLDTAFNEVYYNDKWAWMIDAAPLPYVDVETGVFHEAGHSLGLGHFGPPPSAIMNPVYAGAQTTPAPIDHAGMCSVWKSWPQ